jgi:transcriptional regulator of arginine metabolism
VTAIAVALKPFSLEKNEELCNHDARECNDGENRQMKERLERLKVVRTLIKTHRIDSQDSLLQLLSESGYSVTQATLSRDLKYLKVGKVADGQTGYYYTVPSEEERKESEKHYIQDFLRGYVSVDWNESIVVVRTFSGHSDSVALAIDNMGMDDVLGTISGRDNVVFIAMKKGLTGEDFVRALKSKIPEFDPE